MVTNLKDELSTKKLNIVASGFGVGLSLGSACFTVDNIVIPDLLFL